MCYGFAAVTLPCDGKHHRRKSISRKQARGHAPYHGSEFAATRQFRASVFGHQGQLRPESTAGPARPSITVALGQMATLPQHWANTGNGWMSAVRDCHARCHKSCKKVERRVLSGRTGQPSQLASIGRQVLKPQGRFPANRLKPPHNQGDA